MPAWLLRILPHIAIAAAVIGTVWWINDMGYDRAMADRDAADTAQLIKIKSELRLSELRLSGDIAAVATAYQGQREGNDRTRDTLQPIIIREINREPRLSDPAAGLTVGLLNPINQARAYGPCATATSGRIACAVSPLPPVQGLAIADLALADFEAAMGYADCAARHAGAVNAYQMARDELLRWNEGEGAR